MRILLWPLSFVYGCIINFRNLLFHFGILKQISFDIPVICVGNLRVGGTGKSPHVLYIATLLQDEFNIAILSRGYGRETKGFKIVNANDPVNQVGDEPLQYAQTLSKCTIAVDENRVEGIQKLIQQTNSPAVIILDDAYQHRYVKPGLSVLLTEYNRMYSDDHLLPYGRLRESISGAKRANIIIVTKCPENISKENQLQIVAKINPEKSQKIYFSYLRYRDELSSASGGTITISDLKNKAVLLVSGIENPIPLADYLKSKSKSFDQLNFPDHHQFAMGDLMNVRKKFNKFVESESGIIVTTRKDFMRLQSPELKTALHGIPVAVIDISVVINSFKNISFEKEILNYVKSN